MRYFRAFAVVCFAFGLLVQVSAQAAATPQVQTASAMDCAEMARSGHGEARTQPADQNGPCDLTLECLVAMNCIPPMALADFVPNDAPFLSAGTPYQSGGVIRLKGWPAPPESPPPQAALTA